VTASIVNAACIIFYDPLHELFSVGYYQVGFHAPHYYFLNYMVIATALVLTGSTYFLKFSFEKTEQKTEALIKNLNEANHVIRQHQSLLALENVQLSRDLLEKNKQLTETNEELVRHNSELHQFSYTVSHNLRGPVASLGGLLGIFNPHDLNPENQELLAHLKKSHQSLENTIRDLSHIIDIRNNLSGIRQKIVLREELEHAKVLLGKEITDHRADIEANFSTPEIYAAKHMIDSVLYNLISNAIKYRSPDRKPHIIVSSSKESDRVVLTVEDNGLGLDVDKYKEKLFGLYKRFHSHTDGRGLGLFLVKLQIQAMGGTIDVKSSVGVGTIFRIILPAHDIQREQILRDDSSARLYFDASLDAVIIHWKTKVTEEEYREFLSEAVNFIRAFQTSNWISNLSEVSSRDEESLNSFRVKVRSELKQAGLKHIAVIMPKTNYPDYEDRTSAMKKVYDADIEFFDTLEEGREWITKQNRISSEPHSVSVKF
jgi:signal transduction histidine kinase